MHIACNYIRCRSCLIRYRIHCVLHTLRMVVLEDLAHAHSFLLVGTYCNICIGDAVRGAQCYIVLLCHIVLYEFLC